MEPFTLELGSISSLKCRLEYGGIQSRKLYATKRHLALSTACAKNHKCVFDNLNRIRKLRTELSEEYIRLTTMGVISSSAIQGASRP